MVLHALIDGVANVPTTQASFGNFAVGFLAMCMIHDALVASRLFRTIFLLALVGAVVGSIYDTSLADQALSGWLKLLYNGTATGLSAALPLRWAWRRGLGIDGGEATQ